MTMMTLVIFNNMKKVLKLKTEHRALLISSQPTVRRRFDQSFAHNH